MTHVLLWAMLLVFIVATIVQARLAGALAAAKGDRVWLWRVMTLLSAGMAALYLIEVFRLRPVEVNLPWILTGAVVWVGVMGIAMPLDARARLRTTVHAANRLRAAVDKVKQ